MTVVRTRIAPSPTGFPHVGTAYIALFNLCFARQHGGQFILRIEDTDQVRSTLESEAQILASLKWLGLTWDEGPDVGGKHAPYRQSERSAIYQQHAAELVTKGHAFHCFCDSHRLETLRQQQQANKENLGYDGHCLQLSTEQIHAKLAAGESHVIRMKVPREGVCEVDDMLRGKIEIDWANVDMQVLLKADGLPTYHLANVVDDHLMEITHVIRGEEWINSAPKHLLLYKYFGWQAPVLCHMPLLRNPDKSKLSKRKNPTSITYYQRMGYLPEALLNYLGRMGWSMPDEREKFSLAEMISHFDLSRVSLGGPIFDVEKLSWLNGQWLKELPLTDFMAAFQQWAINPQYLSLVAKQIQPRIQTLSDAAQWAAFFFAGNVNLSAERFAHKKLTPDEIKRILQYALWDFEQLRIWNHDQISLVLSQLSTALGYKLRDFMFPFFVAIAGSPSSTPVMESMGILGADLTFARLRQAVDILGGLSKNEQSEWQKHWQSLKSVDTPHEEI
ncbi:glutamate--tRNA ligase [Agitococcus lubricus]|uniref:Glutamate--tRNA ligase n=1 Tax=Agitococcus lubricus TaxID=1077255 RepID=A0A2T5IWG4_9GAMM|nr:glutamate--tRNA ligase [Agitococcus lubricus]PTQ88168.1 glutamyl-tRNA synthetase [Agitococcus lubricus]